MVVAIHTTGSIANYTGVEIAKVMEVTVFVHWQLCPNILWSYSTYLGHRELIAWFAQCDYHALIFTRTLLSCAISLIKLAVKVPRDTFFMLPSTARVRRVFSGLMVSMHVWRHTGCPKHCFKRDKTLILEMLQQCEVMFQSK